MKPAIYVKVIQSLERLFKRCGNDALFSKRLPELMIRVAMCSLLPLIQQPRTR